MVETFQQSLYLDADHLYFRHGSRFNYIGRIKVNLASSMILQFRMASLRVNTVGDAATNASITTWEPSMVVAPTAATSLTPAVGVNTLTLVYSQLYGTG